MKILRGPGRRRAFARFFVASLFFLLATAIASQAAHGFHFNAGFSLARNLFLLFLEILGFGYMGLKYDDQRHPLRTMGLLRRPGAGREFALGAALGWGMMTAIALVLALDGALYIHFWWSPRALFLLLLQLAALAVGALVAEIAFRGYPFQKLIEAYGPFSATVLACLFFGLLRIESPNAAIWVSGIVAVLLSVAYLRTRALWMPWGIHFAWIASMGVVFGLPVAGSSDSSSVVQTIAYGQRAFTGGDFGPESSWLTFFVLIAGLFILLRITRDISWRVNQPQIISAGIPVDVPHNAAAPPVQSSASSAPASLISLDFAASSPVPPAPPSEAD